MITIKDRLYLLLITRRIPSVGIVVVSWETVKVFRRPRLLLTFFIRQTFLSIFFLQFSLSTEFINTSKNLYDIKLSWTVLYTQCEVLKKDQYLKETRFFEAFYCGLFAYNWLCAPKSCQFFASVLRERDYRF